MWLVAVVGRCLAGCEHCLFLVPTFDLNGFFWAKLISNDQDVPHKFFTSTNTTSEKKKKTKMMQQSDVYY
jgi:hypothetical protein